MSDTIFVTGGTGYIGSRLIPRLMQRNHRVTALVRHGSERKLAAGAQGVVGNPLEPNSYAQHISPADTFIHLIGVPHPSPSKAQQFREIDLVSIQVAIKAAQDAGVRHFIYLSVAHPAPAMKEFIAVRQEGEEMIRAAGINATFVRPWYVLGPGHRWPYPLIPIYWLLRHVPSTREAATRLGLVTIGQMLRTLVWAAENPPIGIQILDVPRIREIGRVAMR